MQKYPSSLYTSQHNIQPNFYFLSLTQNSPAIKNEHNGKLSPQILKQQECLSTAFFISFFFFFKLCTSTNSNIINHKFILVYSFVHLSIYFRWHRIKVWFTFLPTTKKVKTKINKILSCLYIRWNSSVCIALKQTKKKVHFLQQKTNVGCKLIIDENTNSQILISWSYVNLIFPTLIDKKFCHHFHCTLRVLRH